jgi:Fur family ferric uptake transcriptional regulator
MEQLISKSKNYLSSKGFRFTKQREKLIEEIYQMEAHFNADKLYIQMKQKGINISKATIYRTLPLLKEINVIKKIIHDNDSDFYETSFNKVHHDHLICIKCGTVLEFNNEKIERLQQEIYEKFKFVPCEHQLVLKGICPKCWREDDDEAINRTE